jgi:hypothetical protein
MIERVKEKNCCILNVSNMNDIKEWILKGERKPREPKLMEMMGGVHC